MAPGEYDVDVEVYDDRGILLDSERVDPGQGFDWHYDATRSVTDRVAAGLLYLRTVTEGGETEFFDGRKVKAQAGKIALFPPYWTHLHRGVTPTRETKYVLSYFWIYPAKRP